MSEMNYLEMGSHVHCLHCHKEVLRDGFLWHVEENCPAKEKEAKVDRQNCEYCKKLPSNFI